MKSFIRTSNMKTQRGVTLIIVTIALVALIGFAALAIDISNLYVARNELQNAADAGALAGAGSLYPDDNNNIEVYVNENANKIASDAAKANKSQTVDVEVPADKDIQMGHWNSDIRQFTKLELDSKTSPVDLWTFYSKRASFDETNFINAIQITTTTLVEAFFSRILNFENFRPTSYATAFIGTLKRGEVDLPIAVCRGAVIDPDEGNCEVGRVIPSVGGGGWTNFIQPWTLVSVNNIQPFLAPCADAKKPEKNPNPILLGDSVGTTESLNLGDLEDLVKCWKQAVDTDGDGIADQPWSVTLPVVDCPIENNVPKMAADRSTVLGVVRIEILWITDANTPTPEKMGTWPASIREGCPGTSDYWGSFACNFKLRKFDSTQYVELNSNSIYFRPKSCIIFGKPVLVK